MSKTISDPGEITISYQEVEDHDYPAVSGDLASAGEQAVEEEYLQNFYRLRLTMARAHAAKVKILRGQIKSLDDSYAVTSMQRDRRLMEPNTLDLITYTSDEIVDRENLPAYACGPLADTKRNMRKKMLRHFLDNLEKIIVDFRIAVSAAGKENVSYEMLAGYVFEFHLAKGLSALSPADTKLVNRQLATSIDRVGALMEMACQYPILANQTVNIYQNAQFEAFCGHLIACISGLHRGFYESYQSQRQSIERELSNYAGETSGLPAPETLGEMGEQLRVHLLCKIFHDRINNQTGAATAEPQGVNHPQALLEHYRDFGKTADTLALVEEFDSLPDISILREGISRVLNKNTRRKIIEQLEGQQVAPWLLDKTYQLMCVIYDLDQLGKSGNDEAASMAGQFGQELVAIFRKTASIKKPADQSIIEGLFHEMTDMVQLAKFCYRELKGN